jgi:hypothetical protein
MTMRNTLEVSKKSKTHGLQVHMKVVISMGLLWVLQAAAWALDAPKGPVVLQISGLIDVRNQGSVAALDLDTLKNLPQTSFTTQTPWYQNPVSFSGPLLRDVLQLVQAKGVHIRAVALNDYRVKLPVSDAFEHDVVVAVLMNGQPIPVRTKGPLFIIYPFDAKKQLQHKTYFERSIWQLKAVEVE